MTYLDACAFSAASASRRCLSRSLPVACSGVIPLAPARPQPCSEQIAPGCGRRGGSPQRGDLSAKFTFTHSGGNAKRRVVTRTAHRWLRSCQHACTDRHHSVRALLREGSFPITSPKGLTFQCSRNGSCLRGQGSGPGIHWQGVHITRIHLGRQSVTLFGMLRLVVRGQSLSSRLVHHALRRPCRIVGLRPLRAKLQIVMFAFQACEAGTARDRNLRVHLRISATYSRRTLLPSLGPWRQTRVKDSRLGKAARAELLHHSARVATRERLHVDALDACIAG